MHLQHGSSLIEVLIALTILSVGLLNFAQAALMALRTEQNAYFASIAMSQVMSMGERLRACYGVSTVGYSCIAQESSQWRSENSTLLPHEKSLVMATGVGYQLGIYWRRQSNAEKIMHWLQVIAL